MPHHEPQPLESCSDNPEQQRGDDPTNDQDDEVLWRVSRPVARVTRHHLERDRSEPHCSDDECAEIWAGKCSSRVCRLTSRISDSAPLMCGLQSRRYRGVRCIRFVRRSFPSSNESANGRSNSDQPQHRDNRQSCKGLGEVPIHEPVWCGAEPLRLDQSVRPILADDVRVTGSCSVSVRRNR